MYNVKRLARLIVHGNSDKIFCPEKADGKNNIQRIVAFSERMLNDALKERLNKTTLEVVDMVTNFPKGMTKNLICITPNIILKIREMQSRKESELIRERFTNDLNLVSSKLMLPF